MNGWIIYQKDGAEKNKSFIEHFVATAKKYNHNLELKYANEIAMPYPDFAIVRAFDYRINETLESAGVKVFNNSHFAKLSNDKELCYKYVKENGIEIMPTYFEKSECKTFPLVVKSAMGHGGSEVVLVKNEAQLHKAIKKIPRPIFQEVASDIGKDLRLYVMKNEIVVGMLRQSKNDFRSNYSLGADASIYNLSSKEREIANKVISLFEIDYGGVDFVFNDGKIIFNETEDAVGARMLYDKTYIDIIKLWFEKVMK